MENVYRLYVGLLTALALCKYSLASGNTTKAASPSVPPCHHHSNGNNCTVTTTTTESPWSGHFSECPEELRYFCIHGDCRYIHEQNTPSCRCYDSYHGERCEYLILDWWRGDRKQIIIYSCIAVLAFLILLIVCICITSSRRCRRRRIRRRREGTRNGTEKLRMIDTNAPIVESAEATHTISV